MARGSAEVHRQKYNAKNKLSEIDKLRVDPYNFVYVCE